MRVVSRLRKDNIVTLRYGMDGWEWEHPGNGEPSMTRLIRNPSNLHLVSGHVFLAAGQPLATVETASAVEIQSVGVAAVVIIIRVAQ